MKKAASFRLKALALAKREESLWSMRSLLKFRAQRSRQEIFLKVNELVIGDKGLASILSASGPVQQKVVWVVDYFVKKEKTPSAALKRIKDLRGVVLEKSKEASITQEEIGELASLQRLPPAVREEVSLFFVNSVRGSFDRANACLGFAVKYLSRRVGEKR